MAVSEEIYEFETRLGTRPIRLRVRRLGYNSFGFDENDEAAVRSSQEGDSQLSASEDRE